jgi:hypothetical protein
VGSDVHRGATPAWDSNLLDPAQVIEFMEISTTCYRPVYRALARTNEDRTPQLEAVEELGLMRSEWLGGRDSNPDNVVQSHVSYR